MAYLDDHPPARSQFRYPRRATPSGVIVVHTAENTPDYVAFDGGAEAVANFIRTRSDAGSYHDLVDSDSAVNVVRYDAEAYHDATGSNPHSYGVSVATRADVWPLAPPEWRTGAVRQAAAAAARYATWLRDRTGIVIPARRITRVQSDALVPGFLSHAERDPARRTDPGAGFPWEDFLTEFARLTTPTVPQEDDVMLVKCFEDPARRWLLAFGSTYIELTKMPKGTIPVVELGRDDYDSYRRRADEAEQLARQSDMRLAALVDIEGREEQRDTAPQV